MYNKYICVCILFIPIGSLECSIFGLSIKGIFLCLLLYMCVFLLFKKYKIYFIFTL